MRSTCWRPSRPASRSSARSRWPPRRRPACGSSTPRSPSVVGWSRSVTCAATTRYYRALKAVVDSGDIGAPLMMHATHRNPSVPGHYTREMAITDTAVHDIDMARWMFGEEIVAAQVLKPRKNSLGGELRGPVAAGVRNQQRRAGGRRDQRQHPLRLRHPRRGGRRVRHCRPG